MTRKHDPKPEPFKDNGRSRDSRATWSQDGHLCAFRFEPSYQYLCGDFGSMAQPQQGELHFSAAGMALLIHHLLELSGSGFPALGALSHSLAARLDQKAMVDLCDTLNELIRHEEAQLASWRAQEEQATR
jgi:hypothetical protein